ncbi:MAG: cell cycle transcriptional regulator TrcR [Alphaproteobacteria bacterium]
MSQALPLMPKATAMWLVENTALTFEQISTFCGLHSLEVQAIADGEAAIGMLGYNPVTGGVLTREEIARCEKDSAAKLQMVVRDLPLVARRSKGPRYTPVSRRADKPDAIAWLLKNAPQLADSTIIRLIGTTRPTINAVRNRTHVNTATIKPRHPVILGLCHHDDLEKALATALPAAERAAVMAAMDSDVQESDYQAGEE